MARRDDVDHIAVALGRESVAVMIDDRGRIAGRINVVDALVAVMVIGLIPVAVATYFLFRTPPTRINSVTRVPITRAERRVASGSYLAMKLKVRGSGLRPVLRAFIDDTPALGFVFESADSADVIVGLAAPGVHDLILYDGVQEVARAPKSVTIEAPPASAVRALGVIIDMDRATAESLHENDSYPGGGDPLTVLVQLGPVEPARRRLMVSAGGGYVDLPLDNRWERRVIAALRCDIDSAEDDCAVSGVSLMHGAAPTADGATATIYTRAFPLAWATPLQMMATEILPDRAPQPMTVKVRLTGPAALLARIAIDDTDDLWDRHRAASVASVGSGPDALVVFKLGADPSREGWRYRGRLLRPGAPFAFRTDRYMIEGTTIEATVTPRDAGGPQ